MPLLKENKGNYWRKYNFQCEGISGDFCFVWSQLTLQITSSNLYKHFCEILIWLHTFIENMSFHLQNQMLHDIQSLLVTTGNLLCNHKLYTCEFSVILFVFIVLVLGLWLSELHCLLFISLMLLLSVFLGPSFDPFAPRVILCSLCSVSTHLCLCVPV